MFNPWMLGCTVIVNIEVAVLLVLLELAISAVR